MYDRFLAAMTDYRNGTGAHLNPTVTMKDSMGIVLQDEPDLLEYFIATFMPKVAG